MLKTRIFHVMAQRNIRTLSEVAERAGIHRQTIYVGVNAPSVNWDCVTLEKLCQALDCQPGDLLEYVPDGDVSLAAKRHAVDSLVPEERSSHGG